MVVLEVLSKRRADGANEAGSKSGLRFGVIGMCSSAPDATSLG